MLYKVILLILTLTVLASCEESSTWSKGDIYSIATKFDRSVELVLPKDITSGVKCIDYGVGCIRGYIFELRKVQGIIVEFETMQMARKVALEIDQYYARNWVFDDITGEPMLEEFVAKAFGAKRAYLEAKKKGNK